MKRKCFERILSAVFIAILAFANYACDNKEEIPPRDKEKQESKNPHAISQEQALASLQAFLASFDDETTRSVMNGRRVKDIFPVEYKKDVTRGDVNDIDCENLLYVVNFEDEKGFAFLAADDRVKDDVLAVVEQGTMTPQIMKAVSNNGNRSLRPIVSDFPITGSSYIVDSDSDEVYMNPNTVDLSDTIREEKVLNMDIDTLVGNFDPDGAFVKFPKDDPIDAIILNPREPDIDLNGEFVGGSVFEKARNDLYDEEKDKGENGKEGSNGKGGNSASSSSSATRTVQVVSGWSSVKSTSKLLQAYRRWDQKKPFNSLFPHRRKYVVGKKRRAPAGCFNLSIAKILTLYRYPETYTKGNVTVNWNELQTKEGLQGEIGSLSAASLLYGISEGCDSWYFYNGTFTRPKRAVRYMKKLGLENVKKERYDFGLVKSMIDRKYPVIIYACPRINVFKSHCWNIDGYEIKQRTVTTRVYSSTNVLLSESAEKETRNMVHCDFGWGGDYNGYYVSGVFKLNDSEARYDDSSFSPQESTRYNNFKHIVTYEIPGK